MKFKLRINFYYIAVLILAFSSIVLVYTNNSAYKICIIIVFILMLLDSLFLKKGAMNVNAYIVNYLFFVLWAGMSVIWSDMTFSFDLLLVLCYISAIVFVLSNSLNSENRMISLMKLIVLSAVILVIYIVMFYGLENLTESRMDNELLNSNTAGRICSVGGILSLWLRYKTKNNFYLIPWILLNIMVFLSGSKSALVCVIILNVFFLIFKDGQRYSKKIKNTLIAMVFCILVLYSIQTIPILYNIIGERFIIFWNGLFGRSIGYAGHSTMMRTYFIETGINLFLENPLTGIGLDMFRYHNIYNTYAHCNFIEIAADLGVVGLITFYMPFFIIFKNLISKRKIIDPLWYALGIAFIINTVIDSFTSVYYNSLSDYLIPVILFCYVTKIEKHKNEILEKQNEVHRYY